MDLFDSFLEERAKSVSRAELDAHLDACASCRALLADYVRIPAVVRGATSFALPDDVEERLRQRLSDYRRLR